MKVVRLHARNLRGLPDGDYLFARADGRPSDVALVTGRAGAGKTTLLEAIALAKERIAPYGAPPDSRRFLRPGASDGRVELTLYLDEEERRRAASADPLVKLSVSLGGGADDADPRLRRALASYRHDGSVAIMDYFPSNRRLRPQVGAEPPPDVAVEARHRLGKADDKYRGVAAWLQQGLIGAATLLSRQLQDSGVVLGGAEPSDPLAGFRVTLSALCPWLRLEGLGDDGATPMFVRSDGSVSGLFALADAEQDAVLLTASWHRLALCRSVILIDRLDLFAHPDDQARWLGTLLATGKDNQLVIATTSERLMAEIPAAQHIAIASLLNG